MHKKKAFCHHLLMKTVKKPFMVSRQLLRFFFLNTISLGSRNQCFIITFLNTKTFLCHHFVSNYPSSFFTLLCRFSPLVTGHFHICFQCYQAEVSESYKCNSLSLAKKVARCLLKITLFILLKHKLSGAIVNLRLLTHHS